MIQFANEERNFVLLFYVRRKEMRSAFDSIFFFVSSYVFGKKNPLSPQVQMILNYAYIRSYYYSSQNTILGAISQVLTNP